MAGRLTCFCSYIHDDDLAILLTTKESELAGELTARFEAASNPHSLQSPPSFFPSRWTSNLQSSVRFSGYGEVWLRHQRNCLLAAIHSERRIFSFVPLAPPSFEGRADLFFELPGVRRGLRPRRRMGELITYSNQSKKWEHRSIYLRFLHYSAPRRVGVSPVDNQHSDDGSGKTQYR